MRAASHMCLLCMCVNAVFVLCVGVLLRLPPRIPPGWSHLSLSSSLLIPASYLRGRVGTPENSRIRLYTYTPSTGSI